MITGTINGKDVLFMIKKGAVYVPFVCAKDMSLEQTAALVPVTTVGDGPWDKFDYQSLAYTISLSNVIRFSDATDFSSFDLMEHQAAFAKIDFKAVYEDQEDVNVKTIKGRCLIEHSLLSGNMGQAALSDFTLRGDGAPAIINCDTAITGITIFGFPSASTRNVTVTYSGDVESFVYSVDDGPEEYSDDETFTLTGFGSGSHTLKVWPVCANGMRGDDMSKGFYAIGIGAAFNTILLFPSAVFSSEEAVSGTVAAINAVTKFEFNASYLHRTGTPRTMNIHVGGVLKMVIDFLSDYMTRQCRFTDTTGTQYTFNFINGDKFL